MHDAILHSLDQLTSYPVLLFIILIVATFVLEDAATIAAASLALLGKIAPFSAYIAVMIGIVLGDIGLYYGGFCSQKWRWLNQKMKKYDLNKYQEKVKEHAFMTIIISRFVPGTRLPVYLSMGYFNVPIEKFMIAVLIAVAGWTSLLFWGWYYIGAIIKDYLSPQYMIGFALILALAYYIIVRFRKNNKKGIR